jgi:hypothetical protein
MEIARDTSRDSRHMRSIAIVTMVFLPGTFFAVCCRGWYLTISFIRLILQMPGVVLHDIF